MRKPRKQPDAILQRIEIGESESLRICEVCGKPGMTMLVCKA